METTIARPNYIGARFFSTEDLSIESNLQKAEDIIINFTKNSTITDINQILELYNIIKLFETNILLPDWNDTYYKQLKDTVTNFHPIIGHYFSTINDNNLLSIYLNVSFSYIESFWIAFEQYGLYKRISAKAFINCISSGEVQLWHILTHKKIVTTYDAELTTYMLANHRSAELIIKHHLVKSDANSHEYFFPQNLTPDKKILLITYYIASDCSNPNYLEVITQGKSTSEFPLTDKIRLSAKRKYDTFWENHFSTHAGLKYGPTVAFAKIDHAVKINLEDPMNPELVYSTTWISENLDQPTLLNNFIYLFGFVDKYFRSTFPSTQTNIGSLEKLTGLKSKNAYNGGISFKLYDMLSMLQMMAYYKQLLVHNIRIEELFQWFFEIYLKDEFNVDGFIFNPPSLDSTFLEKNRTICSELDSVLKQFNMYVEDGIIDRELLELSSSTPLFSQIKSFNSQKYGYMKNQDLATASYLLFSDQALLSYTERTKEMYTTFSELLLKEEMKFSDFYDYQKTQLNFLLDKKIITKDDQDFLRLPLDKHYLLKDIYHNEVLCTTYYDLSFLDELILDKKIILEGTLFSKPEQNYLDYMLNDHKFDNGLKLRNKYIHGSNPSNSAQHENDYFQLLKIFTLVIIKINEEFCRRDDTWNKK